MKPYEFNDNNIYGMVARQLEEVADSLENNILKDKAEDLALIMQANTGENGVLLCEKYQKVLEDLSGIKEEVICCGDKFNVKKLVESSPQEG